MIEILKKMFEENPKKRTIVLQGKCSACSCRTIIEITPTSGGFGLHGGALLKSSPDKHLIKCPDCYHENPKIADNQKEENKLIKILIVESELRSRRILSSFLYPFGKVDIAVNGKEAFAVVKKAFEDNQPYELIFLDIMMHKFDGIETLKKIRQLEIQHEMNGGIRSKIIVTSANADRDIILKAAKADCTSYMIKPIDKTRLYNEIRKHGFNTP